MLINEEKLAGPNTRFEFGRYKRSEFYKGHKCGDWFETCTDSRHGPGSQHSRSLYFYASFHVVHQLLLTKNCLKLIVSGPGKFCHAMSLWSSILQNMEKRRMTLHSQFDKQKNLWLAYSCFYSNICIIQNIKCFKKHMLFNKCFLKMTFWGN